MLFACTYNQVYTDVVISIGRCHSDVSTTMIYTCSAPRLRALQALLNLSQAPPIPRPSGPTDHESQAIKTSRQEDARKRNPEPVPFGQEDVTEQQ